MSEITANKIEKKKNTAELDKYDCGFAVVCKDAPPAQAPAAGGSGGTRTAGRGRQKNLCGRPELVLTF